MSTVRAIGGMMMLNFVGSFAGLLTSIVLAYIYGTSRSIEIFFAAAALQVSMAQLAQSGPIGDIFLPLYHKIKESLGAESAFKAFSVMFNWVFLFLLIQCGALYLFSGVLVEFLVPGFSPEDREFTESIFISLLPIIMFGVLASLLSTLANAEHWFGLPEGLTAAARIINLLVIVIASSSLGIWALVLGKWVSEGIRFVAWIVLLVKMRYRHHFLLVTEGFSVWEVVKRLAYNFLNIVAEQVYVFVITASASLLPQGTYAVFKYVQQLHQNVHVIALRPIVTVFFTQCSVAYAKGASSVRTLARLAVSRGLMISTLAFVGAMVIGENVLQVIWGSEKFGSDQIEQAKQILIAFFLLFYISTLAHVWRKTALVADLTRNIFIFQAASRVLSAAVAYFLISKFGFDGLIMTVFIGGCLSAFAYLSVLAIWRRELIAWYSLSDFLKWALCGFNGYLIGIYILRAVEKSDSSKIILLIENAGVGLGVVLGVITSAWVFNASNMKVTILNIFRRLAREYGNSFRK